MFSPDSVVDFRDGLAEKTGGRKSVTGALDNLSCEMYILR